MQTYGNNSNSGVAAYSLSEDAIVITFKRGGTYEYTTESAGAENIAAMKELAEKGKGLQTFINKVNPGFAGKKSA